MASMLQYDVNHVTVNILQHLRFSQLSLQEKIAIKKQGRPTPEIQITQPGISNNKKYSRSFNTEWYQRKSWLCGCEVRNALFCFPCLLFGGDLTWTKIGFTSINKLKEKTGKHESSKKHIDNVISLTLLNSVNTEEHLSEANRLTICEHNRKVTKNREILSKIIDLIKFCGQFEISFCGHNEKDDSANSKVFRELINFASKLDPDLKNHLQSNAAFTDISETIQTDILDCLLQICRDEIKREIKEASFVAVMADDTSDVSEFTEIVIVLRYELNGDIFERFWGIFTPENQTADGISKCILDQLDIILEGNTDKLIAQTFDGAILMKGKKGEVQAKIKEVYKNAHFIHCYTHKLNDMMRNAASTTRNSKIFFSNLMSIPTFFSRSTQCVSVLSKHMDSCVPNSTTRWNFNTNTVNSVYENFESLKKCMEEIQVTANSDKMITEATGIMNVLSNENFCFWLELFYQIMPHVEVIYNQMQSQQIDTSKIHEYVANFKNAIVKIRNSKYCENASETLMLEAKELCDYINIDIVERYSFTKQLIAAKLLNKKNFVVFHRKMPKDEIRDTTEAYPMIEKEKLMTELQVFYSRKDLHNYCKLIDLMKFISENNLAEVLVELIKLIKILLTVPMTMSDPERCHATLKRIKSFLRSTKHQERQNALAMLTIEKTLINSEPNLNEKVIDLFSTNKNQRMDFIFKDYSSRVMTLKRQEVTEEKTVNRYQRKKATPAHKSQEKSSVNQASTNQLNPNLTANVRQRWEVPRCLLLLEEMCQDLDFTGFVAIYTFENIVKGSPYCSDVISKKSLVASDQIPHLCECFLVNENGKVGCCLYRVFSDILGEETVYQLGFHTRSFHEILLTFLKSAGYIVTDPPNMDITFLLDLLTSYLNALSDGL